MSEVSRYIKWLLGTVFFLAALFVPNVSAQKILTDIFYRVDAYNKSLRSLRVDVKMVKYNSQLDVSDTLLGTAAYLPRTGRLPRYFYLEWNKPVEEQISIIGNDFELYRPRLSQVIYGKIDTTAKQVPGGALDFLHMSADEIKANFSITYLGEERLRGWWRLGHLQITPTKATVYNYAELWVDQSGMIRRVRITENNGDTTTVFLTNIQKNLTINSDIFKLKYPGNVKKIQA